MKPPSLFPNDIPSIESWMYRLSRCGSDRACGIPYHWELAGPHGGDYFLLVTTDEQHARLKEAGEYLRRQQDVVNLNWVDLRNIKTENEKQGSLRPA